MRSAREERVVGEEVAPGIDEKNHSDEAAYDAEDGATQARTGRAARREPVEQVAAGIAGGEREQDR